MITGAGVHGPPRITVETAGVATVQDLGRPGHGHQGISVNGASDRWSAQVANTLVGNAVGTPLIEVTGSTLALHLDSDVLLCVTGGDTQPTVAGRPVPSWEPVVVEAGASLRVPAPLRGLRTYVAVAGGIKARKVLGSYAHPLFRLGADRPTWTTRSVLDVTTGPEFAEFDADELRGPWTVSEQSDAVGLRAEGPTPTRATSAEILSRGVPVGAVEVPPSGGLLILLHGRLVTAGYPVPYVATTSALDRLGQVRPGEELLLHEIALSDAVTQGRVRRQRLSELATRTATALRTSGLGALVGPGHLSETA